MDAEVDHRSQAWFLRRLTAGLCLLASLPTSDSSTSASKIWQEALSRLLLGYRLRPASCGALCPLANSCSFRRS
jgi:hypothetical protein